MKLIVLFGFCGLIVSVLATVSHSAGPGCNTGEARAFVAIESDPPFLVGIIPNRFTGERRYFSVRYNCRGGSAQVRRVDEGLYDVRFPGLRPRAVVVSAISDEGTTASALPLGNDTVRVTLRGPLDGSEIASRRDVAFSIVVF